MLNFKVKGKYLLLIVLYCCTYGVMAQNEVKGIVTDSDNEPLPGVTVLEKGTTNGAITDADGSYTVSVAENATLVFSFIGFESQEISIGGRTQVDVSLLEDVELLDEVVVIGYGTQVEENISGSVSQIDSKEFKEVPQISIDQLIQGRASGVNVSQNSGQPGSAVSIRIRGVNSIQGSSEPLYVIDGIPVSGDSRNIGTSGRSTAAQGIGGEAGANDVSPLAAINPNDIASIVILKDASATAIYGSRGSNGVILITTKRGKSGDSKLSYNSFFAVQRPTNIAEVMNLQQYATLQNAIGELYALPEQVEFLNPSLLGEGTNWQKEIFDDAFMQNHQLSLTGGSDNHNYFISTGFVDQDGTVLGSGFNRVSARANVNSKINHWIDGGFSFTASRTKEQISLSNSSNGIISLSLLNNPATAVYNPDGSFAGPVTAEEISFGIRNPIAEALSISNELVRNRVLGNMFVDLNFSEKFKFRSEIGGDFGNNLVDQFQPTFSYGAIERGVNSFYARRENTDFWILKQLFTYTDTFAEKHNLTFLLGHEAQQSSWGAVISQDGDFIGNDLPILGTGNDNDFAGQYKGSNALESYFSRAIYSFDNKYNVTASIRRDKSSKFAEGNRVGYFPSVSASWRLSQNDFMQGFDLLRNIKIYGGYGVVGNQAISDFAYGSRLRPVNTGIGTGFEFQNFGNSELKWESSTQVNLGTSFSVLEGRLVATFEVYNKVSKDFLYQFAPNSAVTGGNAPGSVVAPWINIGEMQNKGIDVTLNFEDNLSGALVWSSTLTVSHYKNKVKELLGETAINGQVSLDDTNQNITFTQEGRPIGLFYGYEVVGLFRTLSDINEAPIQFGRPFEDALFSTTWLGDVQFRDVNGDGVVDGDDRTVIGNPHPDFTFGFQNSFAYKNFDLSIFIQGSYGNDVFNAIGRSLTAGNRTYTNQSPSVLDYWSVTNPNASAPRLARNDTQNINISDRYVEDGSYARIQNISFGYTIPASLTNKANITRFKVYASVQNLFTFTNYSGYDPEVGSYNQDALLTGVDNGRYPSPRIFSLGVNVEF